MNTENPQTQTRRPGPHAPLPNAAAAVGAAIANSSAPPAAGSATTSPSNEGVVLATAASAGIREEDPRARAAKRAAELREHGSLDDGTDEFYIDPRIIPDGWSYEYRRFTVMGEQDPSYQVSLAQKGWESVPASRHPELMPKGYTGMTIERRGMMLMERPKEITDEAKVREQRVAREQVRGKEQQLGASPPGTFERDADPRTKPVIRKSFESIPIPTE